MWECTDEEEWKNLLLPFRKSQAKGNIIIVTTRFSALAGKVKTTNRTIELEGIEGAEFEELFLSFVFGDDQSARKDHALLETGLKIMDKLKGSPLAAKTVGRLLRDHLDLNHWDTILKTTEWESTDNDNNNNIMPALKLSYDYMPFHLQPCFLYCTLFPEDYRFKKEELIYFWIGQDILQSHCQNKSIEDIGLRNLDDLISHGFFKKEEENGHNCYIIHDLLHDLALKVASNECLVISHTDVRSLEIRPSVRHLCIDLEHANGDSDGANSDNFINELMKILDTKLKIEHLRTLMVFGEMNENFATGLGNLIRKASGLRVLHLSDMCSLMGFITLPHLRYLSLGKSGYSEIHIPIILSRFYHLRILDLQKWCGSLDLPRDMSNLTKLGHFLTKDDEDHSKIYNAGKLQFLQELKRFRVNKESNGFEPKQLGELINIREHGIYNVEKIHSEEEAIEANI
ncbi:hypothetical protein PR202_gb14305 [Eleusine coracana subsp. coracana]|uniref:NB-ARC domain-containing protein n=1 Tax=Eleusine coracana subsp. coracana TaxID=191504 RepID=A0AAV5ESU0_ELECO|nr:hypothetical protein PR202_gb14305 [Eleusine coracana subsp. coracana]